MTELIKRIRSQFFEFFVIVFFPLLIYKWTYPSKFERLIELVRSKFNGIEIILDFVFYTFILYSIVTPIIFLIIALIRKLVDKLYYKTFSRDERSAVGIIERYNAFFQGSLDRATFVFRWSFVLLGYLYLFNQDAVLNYYEVFQNYYYSLNWFCTIIVTIFGSIYGLIFLGSAYISIMMVVYRYLFFKRNENWVDSKEV